MSRPLGHHVSHEITLAVDGFRGHLYGGALILAFYDFCENNVIG